jgi:lysine biosynthesis protein LysW
MPTTACPLCHAPIRLAEEEVARRVRVHCPDCGVILEIVSVNPLVLEEISGTWDYADLDSAIPVERKDRIRRARNPEGVRDSRKHRRPRGGRNAEGDLSDL